MKRIVLIHQHDPSVDYPSGIGTFIRTLIKYAPSELEVELVGICANVREHPVGSWKELRMGERPFRFLPVLQRDPLRRSGIPLSLQFFRALQKFRRLIDFQEALFHFHRIEPALALKNLPSPKILFLHGHPQDLKNPRSEVLWTKFPWLYFLLEGQALSGMRRIFVVREDAVSFYRDRYPALADRFSFLPTWVDDAVFFPLAETGRRRLRETLLPETGLDPEGPVLLFVGRFEGQKDPLLLLKAFRELQNKQKKTSLIMIGAGRLEAAIRQFIREANLEGRIKILAPRPQPKIAEWMNAADGLCLTSAFEGMPLTVIEALQCGLPVVSTDVGEVKRLIAGSSAGRLVSRRTPEDLSNAMAELLARPPAREVCQKQAAPFLARKVLKPVYEYCLGL